MGHYVVEALLARPDTELVVAVRDPGKFLFPLPPERVEVLRADVRELERHAEVLRSLDGVVHLATAWGDPISYDVNVEATLKLARGVDADRCKRIVYFSTASILGRDNRPMPEADRFGTDYIRSKYLAYQRLDELPNRDAVTTFFPTLIFGGSERHPISHLNRGIPTIARFLWLLRWFTLEGTLHFIHAADIARMVVHVLEADSPPRDLVLGNAATPIDQLLDDFCTFYGLPRGQAIDLTPFAGAVAALAGSRMNSWDRFCLTYKHFAYDAANPRSLSLEPGYETLGQVLQEIAGRPEPVLTP